MTVGATLGLKPGDDRFATFLIRQELEADPGHAIEIIRAKGLDNGESVSAPMVREPETTATHDRPLLDRSRASVCRSVWILRPSVHCQRKQREKCTLHQRGCAIMKRLPWYLLGCPRPITTLREM